MVVTSGLAGDATVSEATSADKFHGETLNMKVNTSTNGGVSFDVTCVGLGNPPPAQESRSQQILGHESRDLSHERR